MCTCYACINPIHTPAISAIRYFALWFGSNILHVYVTICWNTIKQDVFLTEYHLASTNILLLWHSQYKYATMNFNRSRSLADMLVQNTWNWSELSNAKLCLKWTLLQPTMRASCEMAASTHIHAPPLRYISMPWTINLVPLQTLFAFLLQTISEFNLDIVSRMLRTICKEESILNCNS